MRIVTIDFEASCLPRHGRSFPIEVGIAHDDGTARSWLIRSAPEWSGWDWTEEAQSLHGITRDLLDREGMSADIVFAQLADAVAGYRVIADSHLDTAWLDTLARAARVPLPFKIEHIEALIDKLGARQEDVTAARSFLEAESFVRHRAGDDARWLARFVSRLDDVVQCRLALPASVRADDVLVTFSEIEEILGAILQHAADPQGWGNTATTVRGRSQSYAWLEARYRAHP